MIHTNPYLAQQIAHQRTKNAALGAERARLISTSSNAVRPRPVILRLGRLLAFLSRSQATGKQLAMKKG
jgi:hypothetical protein